MALPQALTRPRVGRTSKRRIGKQARREELAFYLFILPWIVGFVLFDAGPIVASFVISLTDWSILGDPHWIGLDNYDRLMDDRTFAKAVRNSITYGVGSVALGIVTALLLALLLNQPVRGVTIFRAIFYLPALVSGIAIAILWTNVLHPDYGLVNASLARIGIDGPGWLKSPEWALPGVIMVSVWTVGGTVILFLAGLQGVPAQLYEAAAIDGAGPLRKFWNVTIPMMSPVIFYSVVVGFITSLQNFILILVMTDGRPANATLVIGLYIFRQAFEFLDLGYASAMAWVMLVVILVFTLVQFAAARFWVHYEGDPAS
jgi:multiple sugar transport system permease protein